jgi:gluconate 2-dehydrogenase gamma chain
MDASRRNLLKAAAVAPAIALAPAVTLMPVRETGDTSSTGEAKKPIGIGSAPVYQSPPEPFFTDAEVAFVDAAVARIIPNDDLGPGAREAGVTDFINHQLAGPYGRAEDWYMQGPWHEGTAQQGYQLRLTPAQVYRSAIEDIEKHVRDRHGKSFAELDPPAQDALLDALDKGEVELPHSHARKFFELLVQNTKEGFLADPIYGGNRGFIGWKLIGFPGPRYNYVEDIEQHGKAYDMPIVSIGGRDAGIRRA